MAELDLETLGELEMNFESIGRGQGPILTLARGNMPSKMISAKTLDKQAVGLFKQKIMLLSSPARKLIAIKWKSVIHNFLPQYLCKLGKRGSWTCKDSHDETISLTSQIFSATVNSSPYLSYARG